MHAKIRLLLKKIIYFAYYFALIKGVFTGTKVEGIPTTNLMAKNLKKTVQNSHCTEWNSLVNMLLNNDEKVKDVITQYYNIIQGT